MNGNETDERWALLILLLKTSAAVILVLALAVSASFCIPAMRHRRLETRLEAGDTVSARRIAGRLDEPEKQSVLQQCSYIDAQKLACEGQWLEAAEQFAAAGGYDNAAERVKECKYEYACELERDGLFAESGEVFGALGAYSDAADRALECRYCDAVRLIGLGEKTDAAKLLDRLGDYKDSKKLLTETVTDLTGISDGDRALASFRGMDGEELKLLSVISEKRSALPHGIIALGFSHTVGLGADGHVYACGDNTYGQCSTEAWTAVTAVAAGAWHTAALLENGTVVCTGRDTEGQCGTQDWENIVMIACADYATFGLRSDGTVVSTGFLDYDIVRDWTGMVKIEAGSYGIAAKRGNGSMWFYPEMLGAEKLDTAEEFAINTGYAAGVMKDGSVICTACELPGWKSVLTVAGSGTAVIGLKADGSVESYFFRECDEIDFSSVENAVAVAASGTHFAFVSSDGSVTVFGDCAHGENAVAGWKLKPGTQ